MSDVSDFDSNTLHFGLTATNGSVDWAMKLLSWNARGLGSPQVVCHLRHLLKLYKPQVVFLIETKIDCYRMEKV